MSTATVDVAPLPRRLPRAFILTIGCLTIGCYSALTFAESPRCRDWAAQLVSVEGAVTWRSDTSADWQPAQLHEYFCHNDLIRVDSSRAALRLSNDTVVRLSEHTQLKLLPQTPSFWVELQQGAAHFLSRTPQDFTVSAPYVNASVDGTEFLVAHRNERDTVTVLEGQVTASNAYGEVSLARLEEAYAAPGNAPQKRLEIQLRDAVSWTLHYPQLSSLQRGAPNDIAGLVKGGQIDAARARLEALPALAESAALQNLLTSLNLYSGRVAAARAANARALRLDPDSPDALALRAMMALAEGEREQAAAQTGELTQRSAGNASVWLVHSYVLQAQFELEAAYRAAGRAVQLAPSDSALWLRRAELALNLDRTRATHSALTEAERLAPRNVDAELLHGILDLKQRHFSRARQRFAAVVEADSGHALGHFTLGLTDIRLGQLQAGRERLELAALLDPNNSLYRSYLGKAYFEERRFPLADTQYDLAKTFDPADPTPYFYSALQQQYLNRPHLAFEQIELAVAKNDNRALFRSRLQLDADEAARVASQAEIYRDIGLEERAQFLAGQAIAAAPGAHTGHRMMAESLVGNSITDDARASELLQAQLKQPLSRRPIRSSLSERSRFAIQGLGPAEIGAGEFTSLFEQPGVHIEGTVARGANDTRLHDVNLSGMSGRVAVGASWYDYQNDGFTSNNDIDTDIASLYVQYQPADHSQLMLEARSRNEMRGHLRGTGEAPSVTRTEDYQEDSYRLGYTFTRQKFQSTTTLSRTEDSELEVWTERNGFVVRDEYLVENKSLELQSAVTVEGSGFDLTAGASYKEIDNITQQLPYFNDELEADFAYTLRQKFEDIDLYGYIHLNPTDSLSLVIGGTQYWHEGAERFGPKLAINFQPRPSLSIRAASLRTLKSRYQNEQTLEPTNLLGVIRNLDQIGHTQSDSHTLAVDYQYRSNIFMGYQFTDRKSDIPFHNAPSRNWDETEQAAYVLVKIASATAKLSHRRSHGEDTEVLSAEGSQQRSDVRITPLEIRYFFPSGMSATATATYHDNESTFLDPSPGDSEDYTTLDLRIDYEGIRFHGVELNLWLTALNLTNQNATFQLPQSRFDPTGPLWRIVPERYGLMGISVRFD